jgi:hypothetical protein
MKNTVKKLFQIIMLITFILLSSCERELYDDAIKNSQRELKSEIVTGREAQNLISKLETSLKRKYKIKNSGHNRISMTSVGVIKYDEIVKLTDEEGKSTYTFKVDRFDSSVTKFYNLMLQEKAEGNILKLLEYTMTPEFAEQFKETFNYKDFKGTLSSFTIINETPCPDNDILLVHIGQLIEGESSGGSSGSSNGTSPGTPSGSNNGTGTSSSSTSSGESGSNSGSGSSSGSGGGGSQIYYDNWELFIDCITTGNDWMYDEEEGEWGCYASPRHFRMAVTPQTDSTSTESTEGESLPCPPSYHVEILIPDTKCELHFLQNSQNKIWLANHYKTEIYQQIMDYINGDGKGCSTEREQFMNQCITQMKQNPNVFTSLNPFIIEKQIDDSALDDCTKGILTLLRGSQQNDIAKIFSKLGPTNSIYKVEITSSSILPAGILGLTDWSAPSNATAIPPYEYTIELNTPELLVGGTKLGIASTILHELVHAYFLSLVDDNYMTGNSTLSSFPLLWNFYVGTNNSGANIAQHNQMANSFVNAIACSLQEFQTGIPVALNGQPDQIYKDLAWGGLEDTPPFIALSQIEKNRIRAVNLAETTNATQNANSTAYNPISQPCN